MSAVFDDFGPFHAALTVEGARLGPLLGLDLGDKTIGLAISDADARVAGVLETIRRKKFSIDVVRLDEIIAERGVRGLVLGLPRDMTGGEGKRAQATRSFARLLAARIAQPIGLWDERLSTAAVERAMIAADASRARRAKVVDQAAAAYILQGALDRLSDLTRAARDEPPERETR